MVDIIFQRLQMINRFWRLLLAFNWVFANVVLFDDTSVLTFPGEWQVHAL